MRTQCNVAELRIEGPGRRAVVARFDGGRMSSDAGAVLLREADRAIGVTAKLASCFTDFRAPGRVEHDLETLVAQRVYGLAQGDGATAAGHPYKRIVADSAAIDAQMVALHATAPVEIVLDLDATDDPVRGHQERRFFHG